MKKNMKKKEYMTESSCFTAEMKHNIVNQLYFSEILFFKKSFPLYKGEKHTGVSP